EDVVIRGYKGTAAETYALQNRFTFIAIDDEPVTTTTPVTTDITTTETIVVTTQTTAVSTNSIAETTSVTTTVTTPEIKGDANEDGKLAASDAAFIAKELAQSSISGEKITAEDYPAMDFNQDGKITAKDAADIARYLAEQSISDNKKV
uniref:dockerin type I repeat-containing protein n=1 Tax=Porcipelethomonas ammoniilytica TaxID=2981722 RepID=UPI0021CF126A